MQYIITEVTNLKNKLPRFKSPRYSPFRLNSMFSLRFIRNLRSHGFREVENKIFIFLSFGLFGFIYLHLAGNMLQQRSDGWYVGQVNLYGDLVYHISLINKFIASDKILIDNPILAGAKIGYPVFADYITAEITKLINIKFALFITTLVAGILGIYVARIFIKTFIKNERVVFLSFILFFLNGGLGFYYFFQDLFASKLSLYHFLLSMPREYTDIKEKGFWWINTYLAYFLPQRPFLFAFPITLTVFLLLYRGIQKNQTKPFITAGILSGTLSFIQIHSLLLIFLVSLPFSLFTIATSRNQGKILFNWAIFAALTVFIAYPIIKLISPIQDPTEFIRFHPGWVAKENIFWFWIKNLGLFAPLLLVSIIWIYKKRKILCNLYLPFLGIFVISNILIFQPWDFDNSKLLVYWFFTSCILVAYFLNEQFFKKTYLHKLIGSLFVFIMIFSGSLDVFKTFTPATYYQIFSKSDLDIAENIKITTPSDSVFITASNHNHPIPALSGRSTYVGFQGWIWSHGVNSAKQANNVREVFLGGIRAEEIIKQNKITYVTIGPQEKAEFIINADYFQNYPYFSPGNGWLIYDVSHLWSDSNR